MVQNVKLSAVRGMLLAALALTLGASVMAQAVRAEPPHRVRPLPPWRGDIARFQEHDWGVWRSGRWVRERHAGRVGWWWVAGGLWYPYPIPVYPYPNPWVPPPPPWSVPPITVAPPVPPVEYWYWCEASQAHYPYVATCPGGWKQVPATPAAAKPVPLK